MQVLADLKKTWPRLHRYLTKHTSHIEVSRRVNGGVKVDKMFFPVDSSAVLLSKSADFKVCGRSSEAVRRLEAYAELSLSVGSKRWMRSSAPCREPTQSRSIEVRPLHAAAAGCAPD